MTPFRSRLPVRRGVRALTLVLAFVALTACGVGGPSSKPSLTATPAGNAGPQPIGVSSGPETIRFEGNITTDNTCQKIVARLDQFSEGQGIVDLAIVAQTLEGCPSDEVTVWNYIGRMVGVDPGTYDVTLEHRFENSDRASSVVFRGQVTVPSQ